MGGRQASNAQKIARSLDELPATRDALAEGAISVEHARHIMGAAKELGSDQFADFEEQLVADAKRQDPNATQRQCRGVVLSDREKARRDALRMHEKRRARIWTREDGMVALEALLDPEGGAYAKTFLDVKVSRDRKKGDERTIDQRMADALVAAMKEPIDAGDVGTQGGERPHVLVTIDYRTLIDPDSDLAAELARVGSISADTALRLACDAGISRVLVGPKSLPLDVGRTTRNIPVGIRKAVWVRQRGICGFPDCDRQIREVHHIVPWVPFGETKLSNCVGLCWDHHHIVHEGRWRLVLNRDGSITALDPTGEIALRESNADAAYSQPRLE